MGVGKATEPAAAANVQEGGQIQTQTATGGQGAQKTHYIWPANPETATAIWSWEVCLLYKPLMLTWNASRRFHFRVMRSLILDTCDVATYYMIDFYRDTRTLSRNWNSSRIWSVYERRNFSSALSRRPEFCLQSIREKDVDITRRWHVCCNMICA